MTASATPGTGPAWKWRGRYHNVGVDGGAQRRAGGWWLLLLPALALVALAASVTFDVLAPAAGPGPETAGEPGWPYTLVGVVVIALAVVVLRYDVRQRFGWALAGLAVLWLLDGLGQSYVAWGIRPDRAFPLADLALWDLNRFGALLPAVVAVLLMIFPTGRMPTGVWGVVCRVALTGMVVAELLIIVTPADPASVRVTMPPGVDLDTGTLSVLSGLSAHVSTIDRVLSMSGILVAMAAVVVRYRRSEGRERERMRWLAWSMLAMAVLLVLSFATDVSNVQGIALFLVVVLPCLAMTVGIVDPEVVPIEEVIGRTLVYGVLALVVVLVDLAVLALLTGLLGSSLEQRQIVLVVLLMTALLYGPLRLQLGRAVRRVMLGRRATPYDAIAGLASTLETTDDATDQLAAVTRSVAAAFGVRYVGVEVDRPNGEQLVASYGDRPAATRTLPITFRGTPIGRLVLPSGGLRSRLSRRDEELLGDLVRQAATAARASRMADELQLGRERMVLAREEERRRIRRDLHDGLGPALSGVVFRLESARLLVDRDPEAAKGHLEQTSGDVREVVADVRRLVHDLRPPALDDRGLVGALAQLAETQPVETVVEAEGLGFLPAAVEVAAYRIAAEAVTNVARHAGASRATVRLVVADGELVVEVADDGVGIAPERQAGVGLLSLRERAEELGGRSEVVCPSAGGTVVRARLPLRAPHEETG